MYATVFKEDPLDAGRWQRYRKSILLPGSSRDELDLLKVIVPTFIMRNANYLLLRAHRTSLVDLPTRKLLSKVCSVALRPGEPTNDHSHFAVHTRDEHL